MIKLSRFADYAFVILTEMVSEGDRLLAASDLAERTRLPEPTVAKILKNLARAGILKSTRGVHGGYGLARPPETITITEIITAMDGPIAIVECADNSSCALEGVCSMHGRWGKVNQAIRSALSNVTLSDLSTPAPIQNAMREGGV